MLILSTGLCAQSYRSDIDNFEVALPEQLYPVTLRYEQNTPLGLAEVKNISFHSSIGKFLVEIVDYPATDQRSATQRIDAKINQLAQNPALKLERVEHILSETSPGAIINSFDGLRDQVHGIFVLGQREYHIRSESFTDESLELVLEQTETIAHSFKSVGL